MADDDKGFVFGKGEAAADSGTTLPTVDFSTFIISLNASALMHLGVIEEPEVGEKAKNLALAKQAIDTLAMLEKKTQGNLTPEESSMLKNILYDLRIIYVRERG